MGTEHTLLMQQLDKIHALRQKRDMIAATYDDQIKALTAQAEAFMRGAQIEKASSDKATAFFRKVNAVKVQDWAKVFQFVEEHQAFDLLQRRITPTAVIDRQAAGEMIPGLTVKPGKEFVVRALSDKDEEE